MSSPRGAGDAGTPGDPRDLGAPNLDDRQDVGARKAGDPADVGAQNVSARRAPGGARPALFARVEELRRRVAEAVAAERAHDREPDDPFRGLYVADHHVDDVLNSTVELDGDLGAGGDADDLSSTVSGGTHARGDARVRPQNGWGDPLEALADRAGLSPVDVGVLVAALAPDLDPGFEKLYVYLNDDITRRRASVGLALRLAGTAPAMAPSRHRLLHGAPLVDLRLVEVEDGERPFLTRSLRVPDHVLQHLLGAPSACEEVDLLTVATAGWPDPATVQRLARALPGRRGFLHLHDPGESGGLDLAASVLAEAGLEPLCLDLVRAPSDGVDPVPLIREAMLRGAGLVVGGAERADRDLLRSLVERTPAVVLVSRHPWDPNGIDRPPVSVQVTPTTVSLCRATWSLALRAAGASDPASVSRAADAAAAHDGIGARPGISAGGQSTQALGAHGAPPDLGSSVGGNGHRPEVLVEPGALDTLRLSPSAIGRAAAAARHLAALDAQPVTVDHVRDAARSQVSSRLSRLARRIRPGVSWDDLIVNPATRADLALLVARVRHRERVLDDWGLRRRSGHAEGVTALFAGDSGTGKTLAAEVIAGELGLELYVIDLSTVVDKYVGETEKNLERIFTEAEGVNGVLFFDEADALFGKRSEVSDARDRYANTEIAYLLQRIESFDGVAILATNLRANVDDAFLRRLAAVVDFPDPDDEQRRRLWELHLASIPMAQPPDLGFLAEAFVLSGGNIRNIAVTAAFMAASHGTSVGMSDLVQGVALEYRKLGRLRDESEFGPWVDVVAEVWNGRRPDGQTLEVN